MTDPPQKTIRRIKKHKKFPPKSERKSMDFYPYMGYNIIA
jgi:hypothetical protein